MSRYQSFADFYPFYLSQHRNPVCRRLHFIGSMLVLCVPVLAWLVGNPWLLLAMPLVGYCFAWAGHAFFEHNKPATFTYPLYSLIGDWVMFWQMLTRRLPQ
jgi:hypothetical protein